MAVDPGLKELRVVFDQPMSPGGMSIVGGGSTFPQFAGKPKWENDRTFVWSWRLEPVRDYWLSINSDRFTNFRGRKGEAATPHIVSFRTRASTEGVPIGARNHEAIDHLKRAILEDYSYYDLRAVNWEERFGEFSAKLEAAVSPREFADVAAALLAPAKDIHLWLKVGDAVVPTFRRTAKWNTAEPVVQLRKHNSTISSGVFDDGTHYLRIRNWPADSSQLEPAFTILSEAIAGGKSLMIDVRANGGGAENTARQFAGCFIDKPVPYAKHAIRRDGQFGPTQVRELRPNPDQPRFTNRVALLAGQGTVSSGEAFVMMMKQNPRCVVVGDDTAGASGNPVAVDLGNGVTAFIPSWKNMDLAGVCLEGKGIAPDQRVPLSESSDGDAVIATALKLLGRKR